MVRQFVLVAVASLVFFARVGAAHPTPQEYVTALKEYMIARDLVAVVTAVTDAANPYNPEDWSGHVAHFSVLKGDAGRLVDRIQKANREIDTPDFREEAGHWIARLAGEPFCFSGNLYNAQWRAKIVEMQKGYQALLASVKTKFLEPAKNRWEGYREELAALAVAVVEGRESAVAFEAVVVPLQERIGGLQGEIRELSEIRSRQEAEATEEGKRRASEFSALEGERKAALQRLQEELSRAREELESTRERLAALTKAVDRDYPYAQMILERWIETMPRGNLRVVFVGPETRLSSTTRAELQALAHKSWNASRRNIANAPYNVDIELMPLVESRRRMMRTTYNPQVAVRVVLRGAAGAAASEWSSHFPVALDRRGNLTARGKEGLMRDVVAFFNGTEQLATSLIESERKLGTGVAHLEELLRRACERVPTETRQAGSAGKGPDVVFVEEEEK